MLMLGISSLLLIDIDLIGIIPNDNIALVIVIATMQRLLRQRDVGIIPNNDIALVGIAVVQQRLARRVRVDTTVAGEVDAIIQTILGFILGPCPCLHGLFYCCCHLCRYCTMVSFLAVAAAEDILCFCFLCVVVMAVGVVSITDNAAADKLDARGGAKSTRKRFGYCIVRIVR